MVNQLSSKALRRCHGGGSLLMAFVLCGPQAQPQSAPSAPPGAVKDARAQGVNDPQKQLLADAGRLLESARQLKGSVDKTTKDTLSLDVIRQAEQVEKLARQLREQLHP